MLSWFVARFKSVADPRFGEDILGSGALWLQFLAEMIDKDAQILGLLYVI